MKTPRDTAAAAQFPKIISSYFMHSNATWRGLILSDLHDGICEGARLGMSVGKGAARNGGLYLSRAAGLTGQYVIAAALIGSTWALDWADAAADRFCTRLSGAIDRWTGAAEQIEAAYEERDELTLQLGDAVQRLEAAYLRINDAVGARDTAEQEAAEQSVMIESLFEQQLYLRTQNAALRAKVQSSCDLIAILRGEMPAPRGAGAPSEAESGAEPAAFPASPPVKATLTLVSDPARDPVGAQVGDQVGEARRSR